MYNVQQYNIKMIFLSYEYSIYVSHRSYWMVVVFWSLVTSVGPKQRERHWRISLPCSLHLKRQGKETTRRTLTTWGKDYKVIWLSFHYLLFSYALLMEEKLMSRLTRRSPKIYELWRILLIWDTSCKCWRKSWKHVIPCGRSVWELNDLNRSTCHQSF